MRISIILLLLSTFFLVNVSADTVAGEAMFKKKGCVLCHKLRESKIGPSMLSLSLAYRSSMSELVQYLQSQREPIVEPTRASVMNPQLVKIKTLPEQTIKDIAEYIMTLHDRPAVNIRNKI